MQTIEEFMDVDRANTLFSRRMMRKHIEELKWKPSHVAVALHYIPQTKPEHHWYLTMHLMLEWCRANCTGNWCEFMNAFIFEKPEDAMLWRLRWS